MLRQLKLLPPIVGMRTRVRGSTRILQYNKFSRRKGDDLETVQKVEFHECQHVRETEAPISQVLNTMKTTTKNKYFEEKFASCVSSKQTWRLINTCVADEKEEGVDRHAITEWSQL